MTGTIQINSKKQATKENISRISLTVHTCGWSNPSLSYQNKLRLARVASKLIAYDSGYSKPIGYSTLMAWDNETKIVIENGTLDISSLLEPKHKGSSSSISYIETKHPEYLHYLYRYASKTHGAKANFATLAAAINLKSRVPTESRMNVSLTRRQLNQWFCDNGGKEYSPVEKPFDTPAHRKERRMWVRKHAFKITNKFMYVSYLDEKFFYTTNRRKKSNVYLVVNMKQLGWNVLVHSKLFLVGFLSKVCSLG